MHRKYYLIIALSHLTVVVSMLFPLINVNELRIGVAGAQNAEPYYMNIISFLQNEIYPITGILMLVFVGISIFGFALSIYGFVSKKLKSFSVKLSFIAGFGSASLGALLLYSNSTMLFIICALSFGIISFCTIKLVRLEERQESSK